MNAVHPAPSGSLDHRHPALRPLVDAGYPRERVEHALAFYDQPHRHYHDREHLREMLDSAKQMDCLLQPAQALALLFHDAVYVPGAARGVNEALSAQLMRVYAGEMPAETIDLACRIVIDTADHLPRTQESRLVLDLDLMRLAVGERDFDRYSLEVFAEQRPLVPIADDGLAWVQFQRRRIPFFEGLLARPEIFCLAPFRARYEPAARANLQRAIERAHAAA